MPSLAVRQPSWMLQVATYSRISKPCGSARLSEPLQLGQVEQATPQTVPGRPFIYVECKPTAKIVVSDKARRKQWLCSNKHKPGNMATSHTLTWGHGCGEAQKCSPVRYLCNTTSPMPSAEESGRTRHRRGSSAGRCQIL